MQNGIVVLRLNEREARSLLRALEFGSAVLGPLVGTPEPVTEIME